VENLGGLAELVDPGAVGECEADVVEEAVMLFVEDGVEVVLV
jgi:hypothetical protein